MIYKRDKKTNKLKPFIMKLNIFKKKEVKKEEYKQDTLGKILNVLPFLPLTLLIIVFILNKL